MKPERIILGHMDAACPPTAGPARLRLAERGVYLQFDDFAVPPYAYPPGMEIPTDEGRIGRIAELIRAGYGGQVLVSHDALTLDTMAVHGGPGIVYISKTVVPRMRELGLAEAQIRADTVENPARALSMGQSPIAGDAPGYDIYRQK